MFCCVLFTDPSVLRGAFVGHTDAVWGLVYSGAHQRLLSCSADGTIRLWKATEIAPALNIFNDNQGTENCPTPKFMSITVQTGIILATE